VQNAQINEFDNIISHITYNPYAHDKRLEKEILSLKGTDSLLYLNYSYFSSDAQNIQNIIKVNDEKLTISLILL